MAAFRVKCIDPRENEKADREFVMGDAILRSGGARTSGFERMIIHVLLEGNHNIVTQEGHDDCARAKVARGMGIGAIANTDIYTERVGRILRREVNNIFVRQFYIEYLRFNALLTKSHIPVRFKASFNPVPKIFSPEPYVSIFSGERTLRYDQVDRPLKMNIPASYIAEVPDRRFLNSLIPEVNVVVTRGLRDVRFICFNGRPTRRETSAFAKAFVDHPFFKNTPSAREVVMSRVEYPSGKMEIVKFPS